MHNNIITILHIIIILLILLFHFFTEKFVIIHEFFSYLCISDFMVFPTLVTVDFLRKIFQHFIIEYYF
jgi:hypothetical protein